MRSLLGSVIRHSFHSIGLPLLLLALSTLYPLEHVRAQKASAVAATPENGASADRSSTAEVRPEGLTVGTGDISGSVLINGELKAARSRDLLVPNVRSGFGATVTFLALEGSQVREGERILEFDSSSLLSSKSEAERRLDEAKLKIEKTKADLSATRSDLLNEVAQAEGSLKIAQLYGGIPKELQPSNTYEKYQLDLEKAKLALTKAKERLANHERSMPANLALTQIEKEQAEIELKRIEGDIALLQITAPQNGIIIYGDNWANNRKVQVGDALFPGMTALTLPDLSSMQVVGFVYDTELRHLSPGMVCEIRLDTAPGRAWKGRIESLTSVASRKGFASQHKVFRAVVKAEAVDLAVMKPGMTARIEVPVSFGANLVTIPRVYLGLDLKGRYFVRKGGDPKTATVAMVKIGTFNDRVVQIVEGLKAGEKIHLPY